MVLEVAVSTLHAGGSVELVWSRGLSADLRQQQHSAALWATKQPSLWTALLVPHNKISIQRYS